MVKIYLRRYETAIANGEMTKAEAIADAKKNVPDRWRAAVIKGLEEL